MLRTASRPIDMDPSASVRDPRPARLIDLVRQTRARTEALTEGLEPEDMVVQSMEDASPVKWHLAHTTWFFDAFVLTPHLPGYPGVDPLWAFLFNSYYVRMGRRAVRAQRGLMTRPPIRDVRAYRAEITDRLLDFLQTLDPDNPDHADALMRTEIGCHHEMQHQELLVTDLLHALSFNPLAPAMRPPVPRAETASTPPDPAFVDRPGGLVSIGHDGDGFAYDCEGPRHQAVLIPHRLASRPVTNGEYLRFMADGGYARPELWLSEGWATVTREGWEAPLYWRQDNDTAPWQRFTPHGLQPVHADEPVCHVSCFEADAFARWAGARLPTEAEWEAAAADTSITGHFLDDGLAPGGTLGPLAVSAAPPDSLQQLWGHVWEWTASPFTPYPGYRAEDSALGEYNGKFMVNQMVLRGGSAATPKDQMRASYRNFFSTHHRWQMTGIRLAMDA